MAKLPGEERSKARGQTVGLDAIPAVDTLKISERLIDVLWACRRAGVSEREMAVYLGHRAGLTLEQCTERAGLSNLMQAHRIVKRVEKAISCEA
jgi:hypothetical protein